MKPKIGLNPENSIFLNMISNITKISEGICIELTGDVTFDALIQHFQQIVDSSEFEKEMGILWDATRVSEFNLTSQDMDKMGDYLKDHYTQRGGGKSAWLLNDTIHLGMAQMFTEINEKSLPILVRAFHERSTAIKWLKS